MLSVWLIDVFVVNNLAFKLKEATIGTDFRQKIRKVSLRILMKQIVNLSEYSAKRLRATNNYFYQFAVFITYITINISDKYLFIIW